MAREQVTTVHRRQAGGGHVACAPAAGRVSDPSTHVHAKLSPHARTRWRKHPCKLVPQSSRSLLSQPWVCRKRGPVLARSHGPVLARRHNRAKRFPHARTRWRKHPCKKRGPGHCCWETTVFSLTEKTVVVLQQSFKYFVLPKALKPYKKLQKCQKLLAILGSEDTV